MVNLFGPGAFGSARPAAVRPAYTPLNAPGDQDDFFKDCSSPEARDGTEWRSAGLNFIIANLRSIVRKSGVAANNLDDDLLSRALRSRGLNYAPAGGSANALTITLALSVADWSELLNVPLLIKISANNTSGTVTLSPNGLTGIPVKRLGGATLNQGDLQAGFYYEMVYDGTQLQILSTIAPPVAASTTKAPKLIGFDASSTGQSFPSATNTQMTGAIGQNNLSGTSAYASNTMTVGAGEAGIWLVNGFIQFGSGSALNFCSVSVRKNGSQVAIGGENSGAGLSAYVTFSQPIVMNVGDYLQWYGFHQASGTIGAVNQSFSAYLISAK